MNEKEEVRQEQVDRMILFVATYETGQYIVARNSRICEKIISLSCLHNENEKSLGMITYLRKPVKQEQKYIDEIAFVLSGIVATELFLTEEFIEKVHETMGNDKTVFKQARKLASEYCFKSRKVRRIYKKCPNFFRKKFLKLECDKILKEAEEKARNIILEHKEQYNAIRAELIRKRELKGEKLEQIYNESLKSSM